MVSFRFDIPWYPKSSQIQILDLGIHPQFRCRRAWSYTLIVTYGLHTPLAQQPRCSPGIAENVGLWSLKSRHPKDQTLQYSDSCQNGSITNLTSVHPQVSKASSFLTNAHMRNRNASARDLLWSAQKYTAGSRGLHTQRRGGQEYASTSKYPIWTTVLDSDSDSLK